MPPAFVPSWLLLMLMLACLLGGEPTLRPDLGKIASFARKVGYPCVKVCTNGAKLAKKDFVRHLADSGVNMFDISLHGARARIHDQLVGAKGAFSKVMKAMENVRSLGQELGTNQVVNKLNYETFPEFFEMAVMKMGINYFNVIFGHYRGTMASHRDRLKVRVSTTAPFIRAGLDVFRREGLPVFSRIVVNYTPCVLPGCQHLMADWELAAERQREPLFVLDGSRRDMGDMKDEQNVKAPACRKCVFMDRCRGFDREYFELFGAEEFKPLKKEPAPTVMHIAYGG